MKTGVYKYLEKMHANKNFEFSENTIKYKKRGLGNSWFSK